MSLDSIVDLQITRQATGPTRVGFGIPLIAAYHDVIPDIVASFASLQEMVDVGFLVSDPAYRAARVAFSQVPRPQSVMVGKRTIPFTKIVRLSPKNIKAKYVYAFTVVDTVGLATSVAYTVQTGDTIAIIVAALVALIDPLVGITAVAGGVNTYVTITATAGLLFNLTGLPNAKHLEVNDVTVDPGLATDLDAILEADGRGWYGLTLDSSSPEECLAAAEWTEATRKVFIGNTTQSDILKSSVTNDLASTLKGSSWARTAVLFSASSLQSYSAMAWLGRQLPKDPGSSTFAFKALSGVPVDGFTSGQEAQLIAKRCNYYSDTGGAPITSEGWTGDGGYLDVAHGADWLFARIQEAVLGLFTSSEKVPFEDGGVASVVNVILGVLKRGVKATFLAKDPAPTVTAPKVVGLDTADKISRTLPDVTFEGTLSGAIHKVKIRGVLKS